VGQFCHVTTTHICSELTFVNVTLDADAVISNSSKKMGGSNAYPDPAPKKWVGPDPEKHIGSTPLADKGTVCRLRRRFRFRVTLWLWLRLATDARDGTFSD